MKATTLDPATEAAMTKAAQGLRRMKEEQAWRRGGELEIEAARETLLFWQWKGGNEGSACALLS